MKPLLILGIVALVVVGGLYFSGNLFSIVTINGESCSFVLPDFGRIVCEPVSSETSLWQNSFVGDKTQENMQFKCGDDENTPLCDFSVMCSGPHNQYKFAYQTNVAPSCNINSGEWCSTNWMPLQAKTKFLQSKPIGTQVRVGGCYYDHFQFWQYESGSVYTDYVPYGLNVYDSGGKYRYNTNNCGIDAFGFVDAGNIVADCGLVGDCEQPALVNPLGFDDFVNYLSHWVDAPLDIQHKVVDYGGGKAYCQPLVTGRAGLYKIDKFETISECYFAPDELAEEVDCCPGMTTANSVCDDNFQWQPLVVGECQSNADCISKYGDKYVCNIDTNMCDRQPDCFSVMQCPGQGDYITDYGTPEQDVVKYACSDGQCVVLERQEVDCTPPNIGCPAGYVCNPDKGFICELQEGPGVECGDMVCSKPYEDEINCPEDCKDDGTPFEDWMIVAIVALIIIVGVSAGIKAFRG